mmetsp:Transcript_28824/g.59020  ORF Transcript_28824/g.59020 Transcript_28824/m.59020 type:complete len:118 (-) Transcript_28824:804-1157(-)
MRPLPALGVLLALGPAGASPSAPAFVANHRVARGASGRAPPIALPFSSSPAQDEDCGCGGAVVSGAPSDLARSLDPRAALSQSTVLDLDGRPTTMDDILGAPTSSGTSLVVFLRSFG